jgi:hypothetical protein
MVARYGIEWNGHPGDTADFGPEAPEPEESHVEVAEP